MTFTQRLSRWKYAAHLGSGRDENSPKKYTKNDENDDDDNILA